ncbi:unnamed protein product [Cunninghamella blakesleeana]
MSIKTSNYIQHKIYLTSILTTLLKIRNVFDLMLVDIKNTNEYGSIRCTKKNMYDSDLKYIAISYRWGEVPEQLLQTPDYVAHIISFDMASLINLCYLIYDEPDLKDIQYLWVDAISVDQQNHLKKKKPF